MRQNGLGPFFTGAANAKRRQELGVLGRVLRLDALNEGLMLGTPLLVTLATFTTYLMSGNTLTLPQVFTTIALFTVLRIPTMRLPHLIRTLINFNTGFNRLCEFSTAPSSTGISPTPACRQGPCNWMASPPCTSKSRCWRISLTIAPGELVGITGPTGAGKSCLLHLVAGFDDGFEGSIRRHGRVAHLGHKPWLMNDSIRNNILFGQPWDEARYRWVQGACALTADLEQLSHGDQTLVGSSAPASPAVSNSGSPWPAPLRPGRYPAAGQPLVCTRPRGRGPGAGAGARLQAGADPAAGEP